MHTTPTPRSAPSPRSRKPDPEDDEILDDDEDEDFHHGDDDEPVPMVDCRIAVKVGSTEIDVSATDPELVEHLVNIALAAAEKLRTTVQ
jgi:hypothetical protein